MTTYTDAHHALTEDEFFARFRPVPNHIDPSRGFDGCLFETFGEELAHVQAQDRTFVWTILDCDGELVIESGFHFVNRLGYLIATVPTEPGRAYTVRRQNVRRCSMSGTVRVARRVSFDLGQVVATADALAATTRQQRQRCIKRHSIGDWGHVYREDRDANDRAVHNGGRILSAYPIDGAKPCQGFGANTVWIITEGDRSVTTLLLPKDY